MDLEGGDPCCRAWLHMDFSKPHMQIAWLPFRPIGGSLSRGDLLTCLHAFATSAA